jgi:hypothetical protein
MKAVDTLQKPMSASLYVRQLWLRASPTGSILLAALSFYLTNAGSSEQHRSNSAEHFRPFRSFRRRDPRRISNET